MDTLLKILEDLHPEVDFKITEGLVDNGVIDSFDIITIIAEVNNEFDVSIPPEEIIPENFNSAKSLYQLIQKLDEDE